ncbi:hypothetical protein GE21DRAFT_1309343 [Neurospora crassa]|nr:hypothetical protein B24P11.140 [imported] - Neurospora crassa [Neurospora crassa]KHE83530.1 hypothetical protein GE21DRAFT_1309343 [Neurospora crassa]
MAEPSRWVEIDDLELLGLGIAPRRLMQESEKGSGRTESIEAWSGGQIASEVGGIPKLGSLADYPWPRRLGSEDGQRIGNTGSRIVRLSNLTASATQSRRIPNAFNSVTELTQSEPRTEAFRSHGPQHAEFRCAIAINVGQRHVWGFPRVCDTKIGLSAHHFAISAQGRHYPGVVSGRLNTTNSSGPPFYLYHPITRALDVALPLPNSISE